MLQPRASVLTLLMMSLAGPLSAQQPAPTAPAPNPQEAPAPGRRGPMDNGGAMMGPMLRFQAYAPSRLIDRREVLGLSPDQVAKLQSLAQDAKQAQDRARADGRTQWEAMRQAWEQATPDVNQIRTHAQAAMQSMQSAQLAALTAAAQAKAVLTPEQRGRVAGWGDAAGIRFRRPMAGVRFRRSAAGRQAGPGARGWRAPLPDQEP